MDWEKEVDTYLLKKRYRQVNSVLWYRRGEVVLERYYNGFSRESRNVMRSVVKSILAVTVGICLEQGLIESLDTPVYRYLPEFDEGLSPMHRAITIRHLLTMTSGIYWVGGVHYHCPQLAVLHRTADWVGHIAETAVRDVPGTRYNYKEYDVILLTAVLQKAVGRDYFDFLEETLYQPLGIHSGRWWKSRGGIYYSVGYGGAGNGGKEELPSNLTAREMLHIGQLFLENGSFGGRKILSEEYVKQALQPSPCNPQYGFLWWLGEDWYGCKGFGGQNITVIPETEEIFVIQATPTARGMKYEDIIELIRCGAGKER